MFTPGQSVTLIRPLGPFLPGSRGVVVRVFGNLVIVDIHLDSFGRAVVPPFRQPPVPGALYYV